MHAWKQTVVKVLVTPKDLRELADKMEAKMTTIRPGESAFVAAIAGDDVLVEVYIDQEGLSEQRAAKG